MHFLAAGFALFVLFGLVNEGDDANRNSKMIVVDRNALLRFVQFRSKAFDPTLAAERLDGLSERDVRRLIDEYVREEVLHREALALGLERDDYVIRRRMVQKVEFITEGFAEASNQVDERELQRYFEANKEDYYVEPHVTFAHVFFDKDKHGRELARALANKELRRLNAKKVPFSDAPKYGDRVLYHVNYVERTPDYVSSHFGVPMAAKIFGLEPDDRLWRGPFDSPYGSHLVMLTRSKGGRDPQLDEIRVRVLEDASRALVRKRTEEAIDRIVDSYDVRVTYEPSSAVDGVEDTTQLVAEERAK